ncbi:hypothetical protein [Massilia timonae]|uniref:hypothetical protein n=1 Tax=Massilia timonae TaxID=47229 RepID=UPI0028D14DC5|nr:hypothetical protein [Massilia timonae]
MLDALRAGQVRAAPPPLADLEIGGRHVAIEPAATLPNCAATFGQSQRAGAVQEDAPR